MKVEWHPGELYPRVGFIVTNLARPAERVVVFYNQRGAAEQHIKEGKHAIRWTRLPCRKFAHNAVRLQPRELSANLGPARRRAAVVDDDAQGQADQDRRQDRAPRALCNLPDGGGRNPERPVRRHTEPHRLAQAKASSRMMVGTSISNEVDGIRAPTMWPTHLIQHRMAAN
jgi:hypothetical protein